MADKKQPREPAAAEPSFEVALERLEQIVHMLEDGNLELSEALSRYEEGVALLRQSYDLLGKAERRIELLSGVDVDGNPVTSPLDDSATFSPGEVDTGARRRRRAVRGEGPPTAEAE